MRDQRERPSDDAPAAPASIEDLEVSDEIAAEITGGDGSTTQTGRASFAPLSFVKLSDKASPTVWD